MKSFNFNMISLGVMSLSALLLTQAASAASLCDGLNEMTSSLNYKADEKFVLATLEQLDNQFKVTGCWGSSYYRNRPACLRTDVNGDLNGRFGSCATYSAFSAATAIAKKLKLNIPESFEYNSDNLVRLYDSYGNQWDPVHPGSGSFPQVLNHILNELADESALDSNTRIKLFALPKRYRYHGIDDQDLGAIAGASTQALLASLASHFNRQPEGTLLPAELNLDGWVLDRNIENYCPLRNASGACDTVEGQDQRNAHSALLVGRKMNGDECFAKVRNSWKACRNGHYGRSDRTCDFNSDTVWISEGDLIRGLSAARTFGF